ncbi:hypothetical protein P280DRAFT_16879 [Massarina eburnea CBS 473.64]|uniref:Uncharacterized protein n=1 Tax=Massarina eburnea CBS 473.64 TaxID=1395130 RepID=A0A6A6SIC3_9PLEO|nr:hypothetical protein P280DRAFT_16879 [Massarina eburnea CBS 473.64]
MASTAVGLIVVSLGLYDFHLHMIERIMLPNRRMIQLLLHSVTSLDRVQKLRLGSGTCLPVLFFKNRSVGVKRDKEAKPR